MSLFNPADVIAGLMRANSTVATAFTTSAVVHIYSNERPENHLGNDWTIQSDVYPTAVITVVQSQSFDDREVLAFDGQVEIAIYASTRDAMKTLAGTIYTQLENTRNTNVSAASGRVHYMNIDEPTDFEQIELGTGIKYALATYNAKITPNS